MKNSFLVFLCLGMVASAIVFSSCNKSKSGIETKIFPSEETPEEIELIYDSTVFLEEDIYDYFLNCEVYFSDEEKNVYRFHVYEYLGSLHGYKLYDKKICGHYQGARFHIDWDEYGPYNNDSTKFVNRLSELRLLNPEKYLKHKLVKLNPKDDVADVIRNAEAGDTILLEKGVYYISEGNLSVRSDYLTLMGEPGTFVYANIDVNVLDIDAHHVKIKNLYLSHLNSANAACNGDVVVINSFSSSDVEIESCDINGCGITGISFYAIDENPDVNYRINNNFIHNNSDAPFSINWDNYQEEPDRYEGLHFSNNKIWNNGYDKKREPDWFKNVYLLGVSDSLKSANIDSCPNINIYNFNSMIDSIIPYHAYNSSQVIGYLNPSDFANGKQSGVLIHEKFKPIEFLDEIPEDICDSKNQNAQGNRLLIVYSDPKVVEEYFESGGEDWSWFVEEVWNYFAENGIEVKSSNDIESNELEKLLPDYKSIASGGMGYFFKINDEILYIAHDLPNEIISAGDEFFKQHSASKLLN